MNPEKGRPMRKIDLHIHSNLSSDALPTMEEVFLKLKREKAAIGALTNHIPEIPGHLWYGGCGAVTRLKKMRDTLEDRYGVRLLIGAEIDLINDAGKLAAPDALIKEFELVLSGVHRFPSLTRYHSGKRDHRPVTNRDSAHYGVAAYY